MARGAALRMLRLLPALASLRHAEAEDHPWIAVLAPQNTVGPQENHPAYFATFSRWPLPKGDLQIWAPKDELGCTVSQDVPATGGFLRAPGFVAVVYRGTCTFMEKARMAQKGGAAGVIVVMDQEVIAIMGPGNDTSLEPVGVFAVSIERQWGGELRNASLAAEREGRDLPRMSISPYEASLMNYAQGVMILLATALVALGAYFSTADIEESMTTALLAAPEEEVVEVDASMAGSFFVIGSCYLVVLFFAMRYVIYVIDFVFCVGGGACLVQFFAIALNHFAPPLQSKGCVVPYLGPVGYADAIAGVPAAIIVLSWLWLRNTPYGWLFQDIIGAGFLCQIQRQLRLPNIKLATLLLGAMFFFDIFWVFISPLLFHESVMVSVASGGGTGQAVPMLLKLPDWGDPLRVSFGTEQLLGFGDVALPGLLVSYLARHDLMSSRKGFAGYFLPALIGYFVSLNATIAALSIMSMGQPALLYLVPGTLGTTLVLATIRGEVGLLWDGHPAPAVSNDSLQGALLQS